jgi:hypothetical protein
MEDANCFGIQALVTKLHGNIISTWPVNSIAPCTAQVTQPQNPALLALSLGHLYLFATVLLISGENARLTWLIAREVMERRSITIQR